MSSLIKYEFKKSLKPYAIGIAIVIALYVYLLSRIHFIDFNNVDKFENILTVLPMTTYIGILGIGTIVLVITSILSLYNDLYKDTAYLLLSVPKTGYEIIGSKLIVAFIKMAVWILIMLFTGTHIIAIGLDKAPVTFDIVGILMDNMAIVGMVFFSILALFLSFLVLIYFTLTFNKSILSDVKFNVILSIIIFFVLGNIIGKIADLISRAGNLMINIPVNIDRIKPLMNMEGVHIHPPVPGTLDIDILPLIIYTIIYGALFIITSQLVERKVNL